MLLEDRRQREEETERRLREMQQHIDSLLRVVEKTSRLGSGAGGSHESEAVSKLSKANDIEAYLTTFERLMGSFQCRRRGGCSSWPPQLMGKEQQAYAALVLAETTD